MDVETALQHLPFQPAWTVLRSLTGPSCQLPSRPGANLGPTLSPSLLESGLRHHAREGARAGGQGGGSPVYGEYVPLSPQPLGGDAAGAAERASENHSPWKAGRLLYSFGSRSLGSPPGKLCPEEGGYRRHVSGAAAGEKDKAERLGLTGGPSRDGAREAAV